MTAAVAEQVTAGWIPDATTFGARLSLVRQRMAWGNVKEAATECGLPAESWRQWERDGVEPRRLVQVTRQIAGRSGCNFMWLLTGSADGSIRTTAYSATRVIDRERPHLPDIRASTHGANRRPAIVHRRAMA